MTMTRLCASLLILPLMLTACSSHKSTAPPLDPVEPFPRVILLEPEQPLTFDLALESSLITPPWLEETSTKLIAPKLGPAPIIAFGEHLSIHKTHLGLVAVHAERGVLGAITPPENSTWIGVDGKDQILIGRHKPGDILLIPTPTKENKKQNKFKPLTQLKNARSWDAQGAIIAIANTSTILVSQDHGTTWKERQVKALDTIQQIYVRHDGVIVAQGEAASSAATQAGIPSTWISNNAGISWTESPFQPQKLTRYGSWIWSGDTTCVATLSQDASSWSANPSLNNLPGYHDPREKMLSLTTSFFAPANPSMIASTSQPAPPTNTPPLHQGLIPSCQDPILADVTQAREEPPPERGPLYNPCQAATCLTHSKPQQSQSAHQLYLLADASCQWPDNVDPHSDPQCKAKGSKVLQPPHPVLWDRDKNTFEILSPPAECIPQKAFSSRGLHILICEGDAPDVFTLNSQPNATWKQETTLRSGADMLSSISSSPDGTLILHGTCAENTCATSYLRAPHISGTQDAWSALALPGQLKVIPHNSGHAIIATTHKDNPSEFTLWWATAGKTIQDILRVTSPDEPLIDLKLSDDMQHLITVSGSLMVSKRAVVMSDGSLQPL